MSSIVSIQTSDVRFPTSLHSDGSDAMNPDPDYSAAYLRLVTDAGDGHEGPGFVVTIGRGNDVQLAAVRAVAEQLRGEAVVDHLHEHFVTPTDVRGGRYWPPTQPGAGTEMLAESVRTYTFAGGDANG